MKPTSTLSLLLFLQFTSAAPILSNDPKYPSDCHHASCSSLHTVAVRPLLASRPTIPQTKHTDPHFPSHQLSPSSSPPEFNNEPLSPPHHVSATLALDAPRPLSSSFLLALSTSTTPPPNPDLEQNPLEIETSTSTLDSLPSKPTSELAQLRLEDAQRYWADRHSADSQATSSPPAESEIQRTSVFLPDEERTRKIHLCGGGGGVVRTHVTYLRSQGNYFAREYSDFLVVGIVVLFLVIVIAVEALERVGDLSNFLSWRRLTGRGEIYLEDDEEVAFMVKKPFKLQAAPGGRSRMPSVVVKELFLGDDVDGEVTDVEEGECYDYDSDACEKV